MGVVNYLTVAGEILSETRNGVERDYLPDIQGSTIGLLDSNQNITDQMSYWPYGEEHVGNSTVTPMRYLGTLGCYTDVINSRIYERYRSYQPQFGRWMTVDPLWPYEGSYSYVGNRVMSLVDPMGLWAGLFRANAGSYQPGYGASRSPYCAYLENQVWAFCSACASRPSPGCQQLCDDMANYYYNQCKEYRQPTSGWHPGPGGIIPTQKPKWGSIFGPSLPPYPGPFPGTVLRTPCERQLTISNPGCRAYDDRYQSCVGEGIKGDAAFNASDCAKCCKEKVPIECRGDCEHECSVYGISSLIGNVVSGGSKAAPNGSGRVVH